MIWIMGSDHLVQITSALFTLNENELQTGKGLFFVIFTSVLLYFATKKQQKELSDSEKQYKSLFYSNPNPLWIYDAETLKFLAVNDSAIRFYGFSREEFQKKTISDLRLKDEEGNGSEPIEVLPGSFEFPENLTHLTKRGEVVKVYLTSNQIEFNGRKCMIAMAQDVTKKIAQEEQLKLSFAAEKQLKEELENHILLIQQSLEEKRRLAEVVERINNIVIITDPNGIITWVNRAFVRFTGYTFDDAVGKEPTFLHGPKTDLNTYYAIRDSLGKDEFTIFEIINYTKSGEEYWVELNISATYTEDNKVERYISIENIITERKEKESKILSYNEDLRKLAWTNSHALRKPVASIMSLVQLSKNMTDIEEIKEVHELIEACSAELDEITKQIGRDINHRESENSAI